VRLNGTFTAKFQRLYTSVRGGWRPKSPRSSFGISHRTGIGSLGEQQQGVPRSAIDKRPAPPHGVVLSFHFPILICAIFPTFVRVRSRVDRTSQPFTTAAFTVLVRAVPARDRIDDTARWASRTTHFTSLAPLIRRAARVPQSIEQGPGRSPGAPGFPPGMGCTPSGRVLWGAAFPLAFHFEELLV
jgi:hypothetical protein